MSRSVHKHAAVALFTAVGLAGFAALAGAHAVAISAPGYRYVSVGADAPGGIGPCSDFAVAGGGTLSRVCFRVGTFPNLGYGSARAGAGDGQIRRVAWTNGAGTAGPGVAAVGDSAVVDSMDVALTPTGPTQVQVVMNGLIRVQGLNRASNTTSKLIVYPNSAAAQADLSGTGAGSVFQGTIVITANHGVPQASFSGGFTSGDFIMDVSAGSTLNIRAVNVTKNVTVATPAQATVRSSSDTQSSVVTVPGASPMAVAALGFALAGIGLVVLRRKRQSIAA